MDAHNTVWFPHEGREERQDAPVVILAFVTLEFWYIACSDGVSSPCLMCGW